MSDEASTTSPVGGLDDELLALAEAHTAVTEALRRLFHAISSGPDALVGIERLRLENCVDLYRMHAAEIQAAFELCSSQEMQRDTCDYCGADERLLLHQCLGADQPGGTEGPDGICANGIGLQEAHTQSFEASSRAAE